MAYRLLKTLLSLEVSLFVQTVTDSAKKTGQKAYDAGAQAAETVSKAAKEAYAR